jgi:hypothetical protein
MARTVASKVNTKYFEVISVEKSQARRDNKPYKKTENHRDFFF